jgi:hypothetical protein
MGSHLYSPRGNLSCSYKGIINAIPYNIKEFGDLEKEFLVAFWRHEL